MFRYQFITVSQLGALFGVSSDKAGRWLVDIGLRIKEGRPSQKAHQEGYVETAPSRGQGYVWAWHAEKTVAALEAVGLRRVSPPPLDLVGTPALVAPFSIRAVEDGAFDLVSADGGVAVRVWGSQNAERVRKLLDLADRCGRLGARAKPIEQGNTGDGWVIL